MEDLEKLPNFRFYQREFPQVDDLVFVEIISVNDNGATCALLGGGGVPPP